MHMRPNRVNGTRNHYTRKHKNLVTRRRVSAGNNTEGVLRKFVIANISIAIFSPHFTQIYATIRTSRTKPLINIIFQNCNDNVTNVL